MSTLCLKCFQTPKISKRYLLINYESWRFVTPLFYQCTCQVGITHAMVWLGSKLFQRYSFILYHSSETHLLLCWPLANSSLNQPSAAFQPDPTSNIGTITEHQEQKLQKLQMRSSEGRWRDKCMELLFRAWKGLVCNEHQLPKDQQAHCLQPHW